jgi:predicted Zn-dependent peptidase
MLMQALRVRSGLSYSASSGFRRASVPAEFSIGSFTETPSTTQAVTIALETLDALKRENLGKRAIDSARSYILGQYPQGLETAADWATALAELDLYDLPDSTIDEFPDALRGVDAEQSRQVIAGAFPDSDDVDIVLIGDAARIRTEAASFGTLSERSLAAPEYS